MKIFKYREDKLPVLLFSLYFVADLLIYFSVDNIFILIGWFLIGIWPKANICAWNHHHQHCNTFKVPLFNRLLEFIYASQTGIAGYTWVLHHNLGHHVNFLDQEKDESRWMTSEKKPMSRLRYGFEVFITSYFRASTVGKKYPKIRIYWLLTITAVVLVLGTLTWFRPLQGILIFWLPMLVSLYITSDATFEHHSGLDTSDQYKASRNIVDSVWYNILTGNLGYHTAHHIKFGLHWSLLPELHEKIKHKIPANCYEKPMVAYAMLDKLTNSAPKFGRLRKAYVPVK